MLLKPIPPTQSLLILNSSMHFDYTIYSLWNSYKTRNILRTIIFIIISSNVKDDEMEWDQKYSTIFAKLFYSQNIFTRMRNTIMQNLWHPYYTVYKKLCMYIKKNLLFKKVYCTSTVWVSKYEFYNFSRRWYITVVVFVVDEIKEYYSIRSWTILMTEIVKSELVWVPGESLLLLLHIIILFLYRWFC